MITLHGKYTDAYVMLDVIDDGKMLDQIYGFLDHPAFTNHIAIMPDCHWGKGTVIGFTMEMTDKIIPNVVGVDINCGMLSMNLGNKLLESLHPDEIIEKIKGRIPFGTDVRENVNEPPIQFWVSLDIDYRTFVMIYNKKFGTSYPTKTFSLKSLEELCDRVGMNYDRALKSIGTLGGGNHFIELGQSQIINDDYWFTIHSGSRQLGLKTCNYWQKKAGKGELAYLVEDDMFGYLSDMVFVQKYADLNRKVMAASILCALGLEDKDVKETIETNHNFVDFGDFVIRKGAVRSYIGERMIIPYNMEDGIIIATGKSNPEWNFSAPHGAGRVDSRTWAKNNLSLDDAKQRMKEKGIAYSKLPIDETKLAYKDPSIVENAIAPTADIIDRLKPILVLKD
jgi:RNA-splicing ligase RtcB